LRVQDFPPSLVRKMVTLVESSAAATQPFVEPRKKAETVPVVAGLAHKTWVQDWPPLVVLQMALSLKTQSLVKNTAPAFCAQPISRSIMWMESNSGTGGTCARFELGLISPRAAFEQPSKTPPKMSAKQMSVLRSIGSARDRLRYRSSCRNISYASIPATADRAKSESRCPSGRAPA